MFCGKYMYGISLFRYDVSIVVVRGNWGFLSGKPRDIFASYFRRIFFFLGASYRNIFYDCNSFGSLREGFAHGGFLFPFSSRWFTLWSRELLPARHSNHCLVKNQGRCSFGIFNCNQLRVVSGYRCNMGYLRDDCRAGMFAHFATPPCSYHVGDR